MNAHQLLKQAGMLEGYIKDGTRPEDDLGLCDNVLVWNFPIDLVFKSWMHYRGPLGWVIEGSYDVYRYNHSKHDRRTKYGKLRLSLAKHCLEYVMNELKEAV
jgi:hypothetical protein